MLYDFLLSCRKEDGNLTIIELTTSSSPSELGEGDAILLVTREHDHPGANDRSTSLET